MFSVLIAEDERDIRAMMAEYLRMNGFTVHEAANGEEALSVMDQVHVDLLICDIKMPKLDGYSLTDGLRQARMDIPVLMVSAMETIADKEAGFRSGTDDYMVKPISLREMGLRVNALLRRARIAAERKICIGETRLDADTLSVSIGESKIEMPKKEFMLLFMLLSQPGRIFTRRQIMDEIWGYGSESDDHTINVHVSRLRERLKGCQDFEIVAVKGLGYKAALK